MKSLPSSTHPVARVVPKNPHWATDTTVLFVPGKQAPSQPVATPRDMTAHAAVQAAARALRERKETD